MTITRYVSSRSMSITFKDFDYTIDCYLANVKAGSIKHLYHPSVFGKGYMGIGKYIARENGKTFDSYGRCYSSQMHIMY